VTDQRLRHPLVGCNEAVEVYFSQELHYILPCLKLAAP
jgi:hypothetical protein